MAPTDLQPPAHISRNVPPKLERRLLHVLHAADVWVASARRLRNNRRPYLSGHYAPVDAETTSGELPVVGSMPAAVEGAFLRVGPNIQFDPVGGHHWFDGDGMVHCVRIHVKTARYSNRYIHTKRLLRERAAGFPLHTRLGDICGPGFLLQSMLQNVKHWSGILNAADGVGTANTALVSHAGGLLALQEGDMPYVLNIAADTGIVSTLGRNMYAGQMDHPFTAHPKKDPVTGELFGVSYDFTRKPHAHYTVIRSDDSIRVDMPLDLRRPVLMHDSALTEDFFVFVETPLVYAPERLIKNLASSPFYFDKDQPSRFGVMPRYSTKQKDIIWFELPPMVVMHTAAAWQEGATVKLAACCFDEFELDMGSHFKTPAHMQHVHLMDFDLQTGAASMRRLSAVVGDFPQIPQHLVGRKTRFVYLATMPEGKPLVNFDGVAKLDLSSESEDTALAGQIVYPRGFQGGDTVFAAASTGKEDAGYLVTYLTHERTGESMLAVYDAATMDPRPVAVVPLPARVPAGFHALHLREAELQALHDAANLDL